MKIIIVLLMACVVLMTGCASTVQLSPQSAKSMVELRHALVGGKTQLERTCETLRDLSKNPRLNTERQILFFKQELVKLENESLLIRDVSTMMHARNDQYFTTWSKEIKEIKSSDIAATSEERMKSSQLTVTTVRTKINNAKNILAPFMSNLRDINRYFNQDQTAEGVEALSSQIKQVLGEKPKAIKALDEVIKEIDKATSSVK